MEDDVDGRMMAKDEDQRRMVLDGDDDDEGDDGGGGGDDEEEEEDGVREVCVVIEVENDAPVASESSSSAAAAEERRVRVVNEIDDAWDVIEEFAFRTHTSYVTRRTTRNFGKFNLWGQKKNTQSPSVNGFYSSDEIHVIRFKDEKIQRGSRIYMNGVPFMIVGTRLMECHQGPSHYKSVAERNSSIHSLSRSRKIGSTKKLGCPAHIYLREIIAFPEYKLQNDSLYHRRQMSEQLRLDLHSPSGDEIAIQRYIVIDLPAIEEHKGHVMGEDADLKAPINERVVAHINGLVDGGVFSAAEMKRHIRPFVEQLFEGQPLPLQNNRRYFPNRYDLRKIIYRRRKRLLKGLLDQDVVEKLIEQWRASLNSPLWFFRRSISDSGPESEQCLLLVFQTPWQQRLLHLYGKELVFLDSAYKMANYALPLLFMYVHTNCGFIIVATFVVENEDAASITEALTILGDMNRDWRPKAFMIDSSEVQINAIAAAFPESETVICDFHRKQSWLRWCSALKNNVSEIKEEILQLLNDVAESLTEEQYEARLALLRGSRVWKSKSNLRTYFEKQWIANGFHKKWVWAFRKQFTLLIHANCGLEAQNEVFKHENLEPFKSKSLSVLLQSLVEDFFEDMHRKYVATNIAMSEGWRPDHQNVPADLQHRPLHLIEHMRVAYERATQINCYAVQVLTNTTFRVASPSGAIRTVYLGDDYRCELPFCDCFEWQRTHMPCKHFAAVFTHCRVSWLSLPFFYTSNPLLSLDWECISMYGPVTVALQTTTVPTDVPGQLAVVTIQTSNVPQELSGHMLPDNTRQGKGNARAKNDNSVACLARKVRSRLSRVRTLSYRVTNAQVLDRAKADLETIKQYLEASCIRIDGRIVKPKNS